MKKKGLIISAVLLVVLAGAYIGYGFLSGKYDPASAENAPLAKPAETESAGPDAGVKTAAAVSGTQEPDGVPEDTPDAVPPDDAPESAQLYPAPDFSALDMEGNTMKLSDLFGKPLIMNFWATWCGPCTSELPAFNEAFRTYGDDITFVMVNLTDGTRETADGVRDFIEKNGYEFPVYLDTSSEAAYAYGIYSIPLTLFLDAEGNILGQQVGAMNANVLQSCIDALQELTGGK